MDLALLTDTLPTEQRLALAYTPARARAAVLALLALDQRLATLVRDAREPVLGQIKLAWWRDQLGKAADERPKGEPLLRLIGSWGDQGAVLAGLVDGWELALDGVLAPAEVIAGLAQGRARAAAALAALLGHAGAADEAARAAYGWTLAEFAASARQISDDAELAQLLAAQDWRPVRLPRDLRALTVLFGLARTAQGMRPLLSGPRAGLSAIRLGLLGI